jgi:hypothetical protein
VRADLILDTTSSSPAATTLPSGHSSRFPYAKLSAWVNPFALVSSESEFNQDPSATPEPVIISRDVSTINQSNQFCFVFLLCLKTVMIKVFFKVVLLLKKRIYEHFAEFKAKPEESGFLQFLPFFSSINAFKCCFQPSLHL